MKKEIFVAFLLFSLLPGALPSFSEEEPNNNLFEIKSKTTLLSAQCVISGGDQDEDKKRTIVGIGEDVTLTINGKVLKDKEAAMEWKLTSGEDIAIFGKNPKDDKSAKLTIQKEAKKDGDVTIEVKAMKGGKEIAVKNITFTAKVPSGIDAEHSGTRVPKHPLDGDKINVGASSRLVLIIKPLEVSFANIQIREKDENTQEGWIGSHDVGSNAVTPDDRNEIKYDNVGTKGATVNQMQGWSNFGIPAIWECGWYTYNNNSYIHKISGNNYQQVFLVKEDIQRPNSNLKEIEASVSKFGKTVKRSTANQALHKDLP